MGILEHLKNNSNTFHFRMKEEIDQLFNELSILRLPVDNKLDFCIRMSMQKLKLQLYYELKLGEYRRTVNSLTKNATYSLTIPESRVKEKKNRTPKKKKPDTFLQIEDELRKHKTKEELIAENKAKVAKFHPEPDFSTISPQYKKVLQKLEREREMEERSKKLWFSVVSIPMGGMKK